MIQHKLPVNQHYVNLNKMIEEGLNFAIRGFDGVLGLVGLGGRKANYDDYHYEFIGGTREELRKKHYDKSLRLLWKAEQYASWTSFDDCSKEEKHLIQMAEKAMNDAEKAEYERMSSDEFKAELNRYYTKREKEALVRILSIIGHGEAYAWMVSTELLNEVKSTGGRAAMTMQVFEEAKHFVVLRELIHAFDVEIPRQTGWEYILMEQVLKAKGLEKFFGMNVLIEGVAISIFGMIGHLPGLEVLRYFHLDESRHTALPGNYQKEFPLSTWQKRNPLTCLERTKIILPAIPMIFLLEEDLAELGIDAFDFGGSVARKVLHLAEKNGYYLIIPNALFAEIINGIFNTYCKLTRPKHNLQNFLEAETTLGASERQVEKEVFELN